MSDTPWTEDDSAQFLKLADVITPSRTESWDLMASLIPESGVERSHIVELGSGGGDMAAFLLERLPNAQYLGLDGSDTMLHAARTKTAAFHNRAVFKPFRLESLDWRRNLPANIRAIVSSLAIHHLRDQEKRQLYRDLHRALMPGGALLVLDVVMPHHAQAHRAMAQHWDAVVRRQSVEKTGSDTAFHAFKNDGWNCYTDPDPMDMPASLFDQLSWLEDIGYQGVDAFWLRAGHALFGGYK